MVSKTPKQPSSGGWNKVNVALYLLLLMRLCSALDVKL